MQFRTFGPASIAIALLFVGCTPATPPAPPDTRTADAQAIRDIETAWSQSFTTRDINKVTAYYSDDASVFLTGMPVITGKANIVSQLGPFFNDKNFTLKFSTDNVVVSRSGDMAYSQGKYTSTMTDSKTKKVVSVNGKYVTVYMKQADGTWKATADIDNADGPPVPMKK